MNRILYVSLFLVLLIGSTRVDAAPNSPMMSPFFDGKTRDCLDCHRYPNVNTNAGAFASQTFCLECHQKESCVRTVSKETVSLKIDPTEIRKGRHGFVACISCHKDVAQSPHLSQRGAQCTSCHPFHNGAGLLRAPHLRVRCQSCHSVSKFVYLDRKTNEVRLAHTNGQKAPIALTDHSLMDTQKRDFCDRCHTAQNNVGAPDTPLPAKSLVCIMCHTVSVTMAGPVFWAAFIIFLGGLLIMVSFWFKGSVQGEEKSLHRKIGLASEAVYGTLFSRQLFAVIKTFFLDVILERRLLQESVKRWFIHSLIFLPILFRFLLAVFTFFVSRVGPETTLTHVLINKNSGFIAFTNDLCGALILLGIILAAVQRLIVKPPHVVAETKDNLALLLIGLLVCFGFAAEGARILMTGIPFEIGIYSFIGYPLSRLFSLAGVRWTALYPYLWWAHALAGAVLVAYLPYGKMRHVFNTPLTLLLNYKMK